MTEVILASKSPRRQELLRYLIDQFLVVISDVDELILPGEQPSDFVLRLAQEKARRAGEKLGRNSDLDLIVIGADTIVVDGQEMLGKPKDEADAWRILKQLRNKKHQVLSGIVIYNPQKGHIAERLVKTEVGMRDYSDQDIQDYINSGDPFDKAGAYAIQNRSFDPVPDMSDCFANVMGLPLCDLYVLLKTEGLKVNHSVAVTCQESIQYICPVYKKRLLSYTE
jgi:septum formation protein